MVHVHSETVGEMASLPDRGEERESRFASRSDERDRFRNALYEAVLYGLARTLSLYDPGSVRVLRREMGRRIREYLEEVGYHIGSARTARDTLETLASFFAANGFSEIQVLSLDGDRIHARWHGLMGLRGYERIAAAGAGTFVACPFNAMLDDALEPFGKELVVEKKEFNLDEGSVESWERLADVPAESADRRLSLDAERVLELEREQSRQLRVREDFIRIASHELATPLTAMKLTLTRLEKAGPSDGRVDAVAALRRQVNRLEHLVTEMLDTTRLQIGRMELERGRVDLVELTRSVVGLLTVGRRGESHIEIRGDTSVVGTWDGARLEQVLAHLVSNAIKYGEGRPIVVEVTAVDDHARIVVRDRGIGISQETMKRLFNPFERGVRVEHYGGLGLGLYIARKIVWMHGGTISVDSELGNGTTFEVELPFELDRGAAMLVERPRTGVRTRENRPRRR